MRTALQADNKPEPPLLLDDDCILADVKPVRGQARVLRTVKREGKTVVKKEEIAAKLKLEAKREARLTPPIPEVDVAAPVKVQVVEFVFVPGVKYVYDSEKQWPARCIVSLAFHLVEDAVADAYPSGARQVKEGKTHFVLEFCPTYSSAEEVDFWKASVTSKVLQPDGRYWVHWDDDSVLKADVGLALKAEWNI
ncbi:hypothetical protein P7C70_g7846, partial [Phenoliferia sp. Uapishka_3]